ncbi:PREDICTED: intraflagellar transport protein 80 homolog [Amphimedon queenslandica]|uniref:Intraflagellar transport protein 80 homolog n=2 Tax=Amphimedon queenslandica TaxID=400682 RepID=A0AAN0J0Z8_AMPQE|nr:PREDICTED: intraflagellar transport protein 80 homolog [Amphimedon queenslandica]|eukprot:XP_019850408.1 PREDICTED: intraflagellar transport protein 80 homolog [Amphimedon queenslandica]
MKLKLTIPKDLKHSDVASSIGWSTTSQLYSIGDDHIIFRWDLKTNEKTEVAKLPKDVYCTDVHWFPGHPGKKQATQSESFALACTDGRFLLVSKTGRVEKTVDGHKGAVLGVRWAVPDGSALLTFGEDGAVKIWSKTGMLRTVLVQNAIPVYAACWSPDSNQVLYTSGKTLIIKPLQPSSKPSVWKAHDGIILAIDWSSTAGLIISGGEDRKYKVWDNYGRLMYSSMQNDGPITSLSWTPDGELFAVGGFNTLRLCDKAGWSHSLDKPQCGTIFKLAWSDDGTNVGCASGSGQIIIGSIVGRRNEWRHLEAVVTDENSITVRNAKNDSKEYIILNDRIVKVSLDWGHLIVTTGSQCNVYSERNWTIPVTVDLRGGVVNLIKQAERFFLVVEVSTGIQIISYEGRIVSTIKSSALQVDSLNTHIVSLSNDTVAIRDSRDHKIIRVYDAVSGRELHDVQHKHDIETLDLSRSNSQRCISFTDKNHDLYVMQVLKNVTAPISIGSMVTSMSWNNQYDVLVGTQDKKVVAWYCPPVVGTDIDLLPLITVELNGVYSKNPKVVSFIGNHVTLRRSDGAIIMTSISPFPCVLHQHMLTGQWNSAVKLCRVAKDRGLWACLAGMATSMKELGTAIIAYSAINEVDKIRYLKFIQGLSSNELRLAELALFCRQLQAAESMFVQAGFVFRAIEMNMELFQWERALDLAIRHKTHVDTVLAFRQKYLEEIDSKETVKKFQQYTEKIAIDWDKVIAKVTLEHEKIK